MMRRSGSQFIFVVLLLALAILAYYWATRPPTRVQQSKPTGVLVGPSDIYPVRTITPGAINQDIRQDNINDTICNPNWSTKSIRPPERYTNKLKRLQLDQYGYSDGDPKD